MCHIQTLIFFSFCLSFSHNQRYSNLSRPQHQSEGLLKDKLLGPSSESDSLGLGWHERVFISNRFLSDVDAPDPGTTVWEQLFQSVALGMFKAESLTQRRKERKEKMRKADTSSAWGIGRKVLCIIPIDILLSPSKLRETGTYNAVG